MMIFNNTTTLVAGLFFSFYTMPAFAQEGADKANEQESDWTFSILAGAEIEPAYAGSDKYVMGPGANIEAVYRSRSGHEFAFSPAEVGAVWALGENNALSTVLEYEFGRDNADDDILTGFADVENTVEAQVVYIHGFGPLILGAGFQLDILNRGKGLVGFVGGAYRTELSDRFSMQTEVDLSFADSEHMNTEVGVSSEASAATGLSAYTAESGYKGMSAQLSLMTELSQSWTLLTAVGVETYGSIMADSPLIKDEGSKTTYEASVGIQYTF